MTDSKETPLRLPVREMRDEPAPQRAAQEGDLPPLPDAIMSYERHFGGFQEPILVKVYSADQMREYARLALAAAGGGVPQEPPLPAEVLLALRSILAADNVKLMKTQQFRAVFNQAVRNARIALAETE